MISFDYFNSVLILLHLLQIDTNYFCLHQIQSYNSIIQIQSNQD